MFFLLTILKRIERTSVKSVGVQMPTLISASSLSMYLVLLACYAFGRFFSMIPKEFNVQFSNRWSSNILKDAMFHGFLKPSFVTLFGRSPKRFTSREDKF